MALATGQNNDIDQAAERLSPDSVPFSDVCLVRAHSGNAGTIFIGPSTVTITNGYPLAAGEVVPVTALEVTDVKEIWVIASADNQGAGWKAR